MGSDNYEEPERLFMIEFLIDSVQIVKTAVNIPENYDLWLRGETIVSFSFLDVPPLQISESQFSNCLLPNKDCVKVGKSCLFALSPSTRLQESFVVRVSVDRRLPFSCRPETMHIGDAAIDISELFNDVLENVIIYPDIVPVCKSLAETFIIRSEIFQPIGEITAIIRFSGFGKMIVTQFGVGSEKKESFTFTSTDQTDVYHMEPLKQTQPFGSPEEEIPSDNVYPVHIPKDCPSPAVVCPPKPPPPPRSSGPTHLAPCPPSPCTPSASCPPTPCPLPPTSCPPITSCPPPPSFSYPPPILCPPSPTFSNPPPILCPPPPSFSYPPPILYPPPPPTTCEFPSYNPPPLPKSSTESLCGDCGGLVLASEYTKSRVCSPYAPSMFSHHSGKCSCKGLGPSTICSEKLSEEPEPPPEMPEEEDVQEISADINGHCIVIRVPKRKKKKIKDGELTVCPASGGVRPCSTMTPHLKQKSCC